MYTLTQHIRLIIKKFKEDGIRNKKKGGEI